MVTKNAWKTPPGARPNRDGMALGRKQFLVSRLGWSLEAKREFSPREMTDLKDRTRLTGCLAFNKAIYTLLIRNVCNVHGLIPKRFKYVLKNQLIRFH